MVEVKDIQVPYRSEAKVTLPIWEGPAICAKCEHHHVRDQKTGDPMEYFCNLTKRTAFDSVTGEITTFYKRCYFVEYTFKCKFSPIGYQLPQAPSFREWLWGGLLRFLRRGEKKS